MTYKFNHDIASLPPSASMALMDKARAMKADGIDVINLVGGEPDFDTPAPALLKGIQGLTNGHTHYTAGLSYVDVAIANEMYKRAVANEAGQVLKLQEQMVFEHAGLEAFVKL